jgi:hypothetical protein
MQVQAAAVTVMMATITNANKMTFISLLHASSANRNLEEEFGLNQAEA